MIALSFLLFRWLSRRDQGLCGPGADRSSLSLFPHLLTLQNGVVQHPTSNARKIKGPELRGKSSPKDCPSIYVRLIGPEFMTKPKFGLSNKVLCYSEWSNCLGLHDVKEMNKAIHLAITSPDWEIHHVVDLVSPNEATEGKALELYDKDVGQTP